MKIDDLRLGWIAGLIEGEGYLGTRIGRGGDGRPTVAVIMTDEDVVLRLREWTGIGQVTGPFGPRGTQTKPYWRWTVTRRDDAAWLLRQIMPLLGERRRSRAQRILDAYTAAGPTRGTAPTCGRGHDITEDSPNLRLVKEGKYVKRRCRTCESHRMQMWREQRAALEAV